MLETISNVTEPNAELCNKPLCMMDELDGIIESSFDGIYVTDHLGKTLRVNQAYLDITGLNKEDVIGVNMKVLVEKKIFDRSASLNVIETGEPISLIQKIHNGATIMASAKPLRDRRGNIYRVVTTVRDLTELNRLRIKLNEVGSLKKQYKKELEDLKNKRLSNPSMVSLSHAMRKVVDLALRMGSVDSTILIQGESGTGKEVIASLIHNNSVRKDNPFIKINSTAIPEHLLESELFGYAAGAFTGANKAGKKGLIEAANNGTLLMDEIGDLPASFQVKLLRVIQEKQIRRVGETTSREIDVRFLFATHQDLAELVKRQKFREDLFYRLNVVPIKIPSLRERKEDILILAQELLTKFCQKYQKVKKLCPSMFPIFTEYRWPGNVRELENMMEYLVVTSFDEIITISDLPEDFSDIVTKPFFLKSFPNGTLKDILSHVEEEVLKTAKRKYKTTRKIGEALGIDQSSVVRKLKKFNLG